MEHPRAGLALHPFQERPGSPLGIGSGAGPQLPQVQSCLATFSLSFAGYCRPGHPVHTAITALSPGDPLQVRAGSDRWELLDQGGVVTGQLARNLKPPTNMRCEHASVMAIVR